MIVGNTLKFGYGDIAVIGDCMCQHITFRGFKPPGECGVDVPDGVEFFDDEVAISITYEDYKEFNNLLDQVKCKSITVFEFKNYIFDFSNYNEKSIGTLERASRRAMYLYFMCLAA